MGRAGERYIIQPVANRDVALSVDVLVDLDAVLEVLECLLQVFVPVMRHAEDVEEVTEILLVFFAGVALIDALPGSLPVVDHVCVLLHLVVAVAQLDVDVVDLLLVLFVERVGLRDFECVVERLDGCIIVLEVDVAVSYLREVVDLVV